MPRQCILSPCRNSGTRRNKRCVDHPSIKHSKETVAACAEKGEVYVTVMGQCSSDQVAQACRREP